MSQPKKRKLESTRKAVDDKEYDDAQAEKKERRQPISWTKEDDAALRSGISDYGTQWAKIKKECLPNKRDAQGKKISSKDISNHVANTESLKNWCKKCIEFLLRVVLSLIVNSPDAFERNTPRPIR